MEELWRVLEFYSGIGGMRYSLMTAGIGAEVVEAFDINDRANDVYECNFGHRPFQGNIQSLTAKELDKYGAHAWLLSPPCQPYTRQGLQKHSADARASSFIKILDLIPHMLQPPLLLFVENVVGFETSDTHKQMMEALAKTGFVTQEYILSPLQFGIPYSRPRYFCLAKRKPSSFQKLSYNNQLLWTPPFLASEGNISIDGLSSLDIRQESIHIPCQPIRNFLELRTLYIDQAECIEETFCLQDNISTLDLEDDINCTPTSCAPQDPANTHSTTNGIGDEVEGSVSDKDAFNRYIVPLSLIERWGSAMGILMVSAFCSAHPCSVMLGLFRFGLHISYILSFSDKILEHRTDVVYPDSKRCCCFTKSYYRYVKGTGSLLATSEGTKRESAKRNEVSSLKELNLRYFTPREVANLHSLPEDFHFPPHISLRQQYALLGNSLSIAVVAPLLRYLFAESG